MGSFLFSNLKVILQLIYLHFHPKKKPNLLLQITIFLITNLKFFLIEMYYIDIKVGNIYSRY